MKEHVGILEQVRLVTTEKLGGLYPSKGALDRAIVGMEGGMPEQFRCSGRSFDELIQIVIKRRLGAARARLRGAVQIDLEVQEILARYHVSR